LSVELGLPFAVLWLSALALYVLGKARAAWFAGHADWRATSLLGWGVLLMLAVHSLLEYPLWYAPYQVALGLALGLMAECKTGHASGCEPCIPTFAGVTQWLGAALVLFCAYAAFDYHRVSQLFKPADQRSVFYQNNTPAQAQRSWLFGNQVRFAKLLMLTINQDNAQEAWQLGQQVIHFSPEPRVFKALIAAGTLLETQDAVVAAQLIVLKRQLLLIER
jgi:hypothetical protein